MTNRIVAAIAAAILALAALTGCQALDRLRANMAWECDGHGGVELLAHGLYFCNDGYRVGSACLLFHGNDRAAIAQCAWKP